MYRAAHAYAADDGTGTLKLTKGDHIKVSKKDDDGWFFGFNQKTGEEGLFPGSYCNRLPPPPSPRSVSPKPLPVPSSKSGIASPLRASSTSGEFEVASSSSPSLGPRSASNESPRLPPRPSTPSSAESPRLPPRPSTPSSIVPIIAPRPKLPSKKNDSPLGPAPNLPTRDTSATDESGYELARAINAFKAKDDSFISFRAGAEIRIFDPRAGEADGLVIAFNRTNGQTGFCHRRYLSSVLKSSNSSPLLQPRREEKKVEESQEDIWGF